MNEQIELFLENLPAGRYGVVGDYSMLRHTGAVFSNLAQHGVRAVIYDAMHIDADETIDMLSTLDQCEVALIISNDWWIFDNYTTKTLVLGIHVLIQPRFTEYICSARPEIILRPKIPINAVRGLGTWVTAGGIEYCFLAGSKTELIGAGSAELMRQLCRICEGKPSDIMISFTGEGRIGVFCPDSIDAMDENLTPMQIMRIVPVARAMEILALMDVKSIHKKIGNHKRRRAKALLAYLFAMSPEILIMDRVSHYLDLVRCNILLAYLHEYPGTLICRRMNRGLIIGARCGVLEV